MKKAEWKEYVRSLFHPYEVFEEIRYKNSGSVWISGLFFILFFIFTLIERHLLAYRFNNYTAENTNVLLIFVSTTLLLCVAVVTNWGLSTLWDGKASMRIIWIVFGYSFSPYIFSIFLKTLLSHLLILDEHVFLNIITALCTIWSGLLLWFGMLQTQEFTIIKNFLNLLVTALGILLVMFLCFLVMLLFQELFAFIWSLAEEIFMRLG